MTYRFVISKVVDLIVVAVLAILVTASFVSMIYGASYGGINPQLIVQDVTFLFTSTILTLIYFIKLLTGKIATKVAIALWAVWGISLLALVIYYVQNP